MTEDWNAIYAGMIARLPGLAAGAPPVFCGNGACIDARVALHDLGPMIASEEPEPVRLAATLLERAGRGQGGEITHVWPDGPAWIARHVPITYAMGGTGPHAAWALSTVGARAVLALEDRSALMLRIAPPDILLVEDGRLMSAREAQVAGQARPPVFIFEYTAGKPVGSVVPARSSRIIVKFAHFGLERDAEFDRYTMANTRNAGAGLVSGFSSVAASDIPGETVRVAALARAWRDGGLNTIHFELAGYDTPELVRSVLTGLRASITSVGMSLSELKTLKSDPDVATAMRAVGEDLGIDRVCVHADHWAASVTRRDADAEREALLAGCLLAASRAAAGRPILPESIDPGTTFEPLPFAAPRSLGPWQFVACASPYLRAPQTTLGLGDTFTGGCLLALSAASRA